MDGAELTEDLLPLTDQLPAAHVTRLYQNYTGSVWRPAHCRRRGAGAVDRSIGYGPALHIGHGYRNVMEVGDASLTNADAMGPRTATSCSTCTPSTARRTRSTSRASAVAFLLNPAAAL